MKSIDAVRPLTDSTELLSLRVSGAPGARARATSHFDSWFFFSNMR